MNWNNIDRRSRLNLLAAAILLAGLLSAIWIYARAENVPYGVLGYESEGGTLYPIMPEDSKQYEREMELYGGKANVLADRLRRWLGGLFHGKSLAVLIAITATIISLGIYYAANYLPPGSQADAEKEKRIERD